MLDMAPFLKENSRLGETMMTVVCFHCNWSPKAIDVTGNHKLQILKHWHSVG